MSKFDEATDRFTAAIEYAREWKHNYLGAAYSTRLRAAIVDLRAAIAEMEQALDRDRKERNL